jgi:hypothetical protein
VDTIDLDLNDNEQDGDADAEDLECEIEDYDSDDASKVDQGDAFEEDSEEQAKEVEDRNST